MDGGGEGEGGLKKLKGGLAVKSQTTATSLQVYVDEEFTGDRAKGDEEVKDGGGLHGDAPFKETAANAD